MFHDFPYTDYHELNLDWLMRCCGKGLGLKLELQGNYLRLVNSKGEVVSQVLVHYADTALQDIDGRDIQTYIFSAGISGDNLVFVHGDNSVTTITVPFATKAATDVQGKDILDYAYTLSISGDKLKITKGDGDTVELTIPFAVKAQKDADGKDITTYAAKLVVDGNDIVLKDAHDNQLNKITVPYAIDAGNAAEADHADDADHADNADEALHALDADTADYATLSTDATNAVENVVISGDQLIATTFGGAQFALTIPYAIKAQKDDAGNTIKTTYVANVAQDSQTGEISFYDALGNVLASLIPTASVATYDSYNNLIADYIKSIVVTQGSDYVTVTHGTGTLDSIKIDYATRAWKDTNDNVIKNFYVSWLTCVEDVNDGHWKLVMWNGDTPRAEIGRVEVYAYAAQCDVNGKALTSYVADIDIVDNDIVVKDGESQTLETIALPSYWMDTDDTQIELHRGSTMVSNINVPSVQVTIADNGIDPWTYSSTTLTSDTTINMSTFATVNALVDNVAVLVEYAGDMHIAIAKAQIQRTSTITTIFESEIANDKFWKIDLTTTPTGNLVSCIGDVVSVGGGGGSSSATILGLYDPNQGNLVTLNSLSQSMVVEVWDITDINNPVPLDDTTFLPKIQAGPCYFKDSRNNTYSVVYDATASNIGVIFNASGVPYFVSINYQWNDNWNVMVLKPIALQ